MYKENLKYLRTNVRFLRKQHGYSLQEFADILGMSKASISSFESGYSGISLEPLIKIKTLFKVSIDDLLFKDMTK